jgi:hypothetical protein
MTMQRKVIPLQRQANKRTRMKTLMALALMLVMTPVAAAQDAIPQLKGAWKGTGKILLFGTTEHLSGSPQNAVVRDLEVTHTVTGQDGRLIWGTTSSANTTTRSRSRGRWPPTTGRSSAPTPTAITASRSYQRTGSRNATPRARRARGKPSSPPAS